MFNSKYELIENKVISKLYGMTKGEAFSFIKENDLVPRLLKEDRTAYKKDEVYCSHRINLFVARGRVVGAEIG